MQAMRAALDAELKGQRDATWERHQKRRDDLDARTDVAIDRARAEIKAAYRPKWRNLYFNQKREARHVARLAGNVFERAVYVYQNRDWLGGAGKPLTMRQMMSLVRSPARLGQRVGQLHEQQRRELARQSKFETKSLTDAIWHRHKSDMGHMRDVQLAERQAERDAQALQRKSVSFAMAKATLVSEHANTPRPFLRGPPPLSPRQPQINRAPPPEGAREAQAQRRPPEPPPVSPAVGN